MDLAKHQNEYNKAKGNVEKKIDLINDKLAWHIQDEQTAHRNAITANEKIDRHIEVYENNGKEMKKMWQTMEAFKEDILRQHEIDKQDAVDQRQLVLKEITNLREQTKPLVEAFDGWNWVQKALIKIAVLIGSVGAIAVAWKELFKK